MGNEGHTFVVEAAVSLGGSKVRPGLNVFRFANRIPLLFEAGNDVITRTAQKRVNWTSYKINANTVQDSIRGCCKQLKVKLVRISAAKERQQRKRNLTRYIPDVVNALHTVLGTLSEGAKESDEGGVVAAKRRRMLADCTVVRRDCGDHEEDLGAAGTFAVLEGSAAQVDESLMSMVKNNRISKEALVDALTAHVNASDDVDDDGAGGAGTTSAGG